MPQSRSRIVFRGPCCPKRKLAQTRADRERAEYRQSTRLELHSTAAWECPGDVGQYRATRQSPSVISIDRDSPQPDSERQRQCSAMHSLRREEKKESALLPACGPP